MATALKSVRRVYPKIQTDVSVGALLRREREAAGWTREYVAERIGISEKALAHIENGREPAHRVLRPYLELLGIDPEGEWVDKALIEVRFATAKAAQGVDAVTMLEAEEAHLRRLKSASSRDSSVGRALGPQGDPDGGECATLEPWLPLDRVA